MSAKRWVVIPVFFGLGLLALSGCSAGESASGDGDAASGVEGVEWQLVSGVSSVDLSEAGITATFADGLVTGSGGVNSYTAECTLALDGTVEIGEITSTLMAGSDEANAAEAAYFGLLQQVESYEVDGDGLTLRDADDNGLLLFERGE